MGGGGRGREEEERTKRKKDIEGKRPITIGVGIAGGLPRDFVSVSLPNTRHHLCSLMLFHKSNQQSLFRWDGLWLA